MEHPVLVRIMDLRLDGHGNPSLRLLRYEVEALVEANHGAEYLKNQQVQAEVQKINKELKKLKAQIAVLKERKSKLTGQRGPLPSASQDGWIGNEHTPMEFIVDLRF